MSEENVTRCHAGDTRDGAIIVADGVGGSGLLALGEGEAGRGWLELEKKLRIRVFLPRGVTSRLSRPVSPARS
jgi:hypothetical protein